KRHPPCRRRKTCRAFMGGSRFIDPPGGGQAGCSRGVDIRSWAAYPVSTPPGIPSAVTWPRFAVRADGYSDRPYLFSEPPVPMRRLLPLVSLLLAASLAQAAPEQVLVVGLFPNAAVLNVDGQRKLVKVGQVGPGGVEVVSADSRGAVLRIDGQTRRFELSREYSEGRSEEHTSELQ